MERHKKMMTFGALGLAFAGLLGLAQPALADEGALRSDAAIKRDVENAVLGYSRYTVFDAIGVLVQDGNVTLLGSVNQPYRKDDIEKRVAKIPGVQVLDNQIAVQPLSFNDDRLRAELVRKIYGGDVLMNPSMADPPVRIVVANGHVTLMGYVNSEVERRMIGAIARGTLSFGVDNQLKLDSEREADRRSD
jgi:hypothetical protein